MNIGKLNPSYSRGADANTILLMHFNNSFVDSQTTPLTFTNSTAPVLFSNTSPKFPGTYYAVFGIGSGTGSGGATYLSAPSSSYFNFGSGDFTVDAWFNLPSAPTNTNGTYLCTKRDSFSNNNGFYISFNYIDSTHSSVSAVFEAGGSYIVNMNSPNYLNSTFLNVWHHIAVVKNGSNYYLFLDGAIVATANTSTAIGASNGLMLIGGDDYSGGYLSGQIYLSELRISNIARWTSTFTPPTEPYIGREQWYASTADPKDVLLLHCQGANGGTAFKDSSVSNFSITNSNVTLSNTIPSPIGGVTTASFNGAGYLTCPNSGTFNFAGDLTVDFWVNVANFNGGYGAVVGTANNHTGTGGGYLVLVSATNISLVAAVPSWSTIINVSTTFNTGIWYHIAWVRRNGLNTLYVNGVSVGSASNSFAFSTSQAFSIGDQFGFYNTTSFISEVRVSSIAKWATNFTPSTIPYIGTDGQYPIVDSNTVLLLHGDGADLSTTIVDSCLNPKVLIANGPACISNQGKVKLNGTNQNLTVPNNSNLNFGSSNFTIDFWANITTLPTSGNYMAFLSKLDGGANNGYEIYIYNNSGTYQLALYLSNGGTTFGTPLTTFVPSLNTWNHVAAVRNGTNISLYWNGGLVSSVTTATAIGTNTNSLSIGNNNSAAGQYWYSGYIADFRISNIARWTTNFNPIFITNSAANTANLLVVAGGGAGGGSSSTTDGGAGGGGAGGYIYNSSYAITPGQSYPVTVGLGGTYNGFLIGNNGGNSVFNDQTAIGGGGGGKAGSGVGTGANGGSGGGAGSSAGLNGGTGTAGQGTNGGNAQNSGGGGGGATSAGQSAPTTNNGGAGGSGTTNNITGSSITYASGGGGGAYHQLGGVFGAGGTGAGNGGQGGNGADATGYGCGGGGGDNGHGGNGFSGIVVIAYTTANYTMDGTGGTITHVGGKTIHTFTSSGTFVAPTSKSSNDANTVLLLSFQGNLTDSSSNNYTVTNNNSSTIFYPGTLPLGNVDAGALYFDGSTSYLLSSTSTTDFDFGTGDFTVDFWFNPIAYGANNYFFAKWSTSPVSPYSFTVNSDASGKLQFYSYNSGITGMTTMSSAWSPTLGTWYHLAFVRQGSNGAIYINGVAQSVVQNNSWGTVYGGTGLYAIGMDYANSRYQVNGYIDEFRMSRGIARWTSNFTVPKVPYLDVSNAFSNKIDPRDVLLLHADSLIDSSLNTKSLTNHSTTISSSQRRFGSSSILVGSGQYITAAYSPDYFISNQPFTFECWIYPTALPSGIMTNRTDGNNPYYLWYIPNTGHLIFDYYVGSDHTLTGSATLQINQWYHIAVTFDGTTKRQFVNGILDGTLTDATSIPDPGQAFVVGSYDPTTASRSFFGYIDEFRFTKGLCRYTTSFTPPSAPFIGTEGYSKSIDPLDIVLLHFDDADGTQQTVDSSVNDAACTFVGNATILNKNVSNSTWGSAYFNGTNGYLSIANAAWMNFGSGNFTMEAWVNLPAGLTSGPAFSLFSARGTSNTNGFMVYLDNSSSEYHVNVLAFNAGSTIASASFVIPVPTPGKWYHIAWVRNGSTWTAYWNGASIGTTTSASAIGSFSNALLICADVYGGPTGDYLNAYLSQVRFSNIARWTTNFTSPIMGTLTSDANTMLLLQTGAMQVDASSNANVITNTSVPVYPLTPALSHGGVLGLNLSGTSTDYLTLPYSSYMNLGTNNFTMECWAMLYTLTGGDGDNQVFINQGVEPSSLQFILRYEHSTATLQFYYSNNGSVTGSFTCPWTPSLNTWYHIAVVRNGASILLFINGILQTTGNIGASFSFFASTQPLYIGNRLTTNQTLSGCLDEVRITNGVAKYISNFTPSTTRYTGREDVLGRNVSFPGFYKVADFTSAGTETSYVVNVDGDTDLEYKIVGRNLANAQLLLNLNGDSGNNYGYEEIGNSGGSISASSNVYTAIQIDATYQSMFELDLHTPQGFQKIATLADVRYGSGTTLNNIYFWTFSWNNTANVKTLNFAPASGTFVAGTRIMVFARRKQ